MSIKLKMKPNIEKLGRSYISYSYQWPTESMW